MDTEITPSPECLPTPPPNLRSFDEYDEQHVDELFMMGKIPFTACSYDNRFSYCLYIPQSYKSLDSLKLVVLVHSSFRDAAELRDAFVSLADANGTVILAPLFPQGILDPEDRDNYKALEYRGIRFDLVLLAIIQEAAQRWPKMETDKFLMQGFSGGGQFAHRFAYLHPERLYAAVICAPGNATLLDWGYEFPSGVRDLAMRFAVQWNPDALRRIPVLMLVGEQDTGVQHLVARGKHHAMGGLQFPLGLKNRHEVLEELYSSWCAYGISAKLVKIPGAAHEPEKMYALTEAFFAEVLVQLRAEASDNTASH